ncbi:MAG: hypothetical protein MJK04_35450 [Psychrosphaera sp.]|nr:hypothetical protein [Psychrosphaera sp.]
MLTLLKKCKICLIIPLILLTSCSGDQQAKVAEAQEQEQAMAIRANQAFEKSQRALAIAAEKKRILQQSTLVHNSDAIANAAEQQLLQSAIDRAYQDEQQLLKMAKQKKQSLEDELK